MLAEDDPVKMEMDIVDEQLDTTARTFMGLTVGCARCHDHKFDPIPQADYYSLAGIFKSSKTMENFKVVAQWHEYVLAPEPEREKLEQHTARIEAKKQRDRPDLRWGKQETRERRARSTQADYLLAADDVLRYESIALRPAASGGKTPARAVRRPAAASSAATRRESWRRKSRTRPKASRDLTSLSMTSRSRRRGITNWTCWNRSRAPARWICWSTACWNSAASDR